MSYAEQPGAHNDADDRLGLAKRITAPVEDPTDRLSGLAHHMAQPLEVEPDVRAIIMLLTDDLPTGGHATTLTVGFDAYGEDAQIRVVVALLRNAEAVLRAHGRTLREALDTIYQEAP